MQTIQHTFCRVSLRSGHLAAAAELVLSLRVTLLDLHSSIATVWHETAMPPKTMPTFTMSCYCIQSCKDTIPCYLLSCNRHYVQNVRYTRGSPPSKPANFCLRRSKALSASAFAIVVSVLPTASGAMPAGVGWGPLAPSPGLLSSPPIRKSFWRC